MDVRRRINSFEEYKEEYQKSVDNPEAFWAGHAESFVWKKKWDKVLDWNFGTKQDAQTCFKHTGHLDAPVAVHPCTEHRKRESSRLPVCVELKHALDLGSRK